MLFPPCLLEHVSILYSGYYHVYRIPSWLFLSQPFEDVTRLTSGFCSCWRSPPVTGFQQFDCDVLFGLVLSWCVCFILPGLFRFLEPWVCSFHQIWENFQHFKIESLPGSFCVFYHCWGCVFSTSEIEPFLQSSPCSCVLLPPLFPSFSFQAPTLACIFIHTASVSGDDWLLS